MLRRPQEGAEWPGLLQWGGWGSTQGHPPPAKVEGAEKTAGRREVFWLAGRGGHKDHLPTGKVQKRPQEGAWCWGGCVDVCVSQGPPPMGEGAEETPEGTACPGLLEGERETGTPPPQKALPKIYVSPRGPKQLVESTLGGAGKKYQ